MSHIEVTILTEDSEQAQWLPSLLDTNGVNGWQEQTDYLVAFVEAARWPDIEPVWLEALSQFHLTYTTQAIADQNWNETWEQHFEPVVVNEAVAVRATFHAPMAHVQHEIVIDPTRAFGTGHHETTFMMLDRMSRLDMTSQRVLDYGCGTGILAIYAHKLGAATIWGNDIEEPAIEIAHRNAELNHTPGIHFVLGDIDCIPQGTYDTVLANIHRAVLVVAMPLLARLLSSTGRLLISGILLDDSPHIEAALESTGLMAVERRVMGRWQMWVIVHKTAD